MPAACRAAIGDGLARGGQIERAAAWLAGEDPAGWPMTALFARAFWNIEGARSWDSVVILATARNPYRDPVYSLLQLDFANLSRLIMHQAVGANHLPAGVRRCD